MNDDPAQPIRNDRSPVVVYQPDQEDLLELSLRLAHSIRNPLATINSSAQLLQRLKLEAEAAYPYLHGMLDEVRRINAVLQRLEDFARLEAGTKSTVDLRTIVNRCIDQACESARKDRIVLRAVTTEEPALIETDRLLLGRAVQELIDNAHAASSPNSVVTIGVDSVSGEHTTIYVADEGSGIPQAIAPRVMVPFFSTHRERVGLGLNIVQRTSAMLGARLTWENGRDSGVRFNIVFSEA
jgi:signal transduction histidine kinase